MDGDTQGLNIITAIGSPGEIRKIKLNLVPALVKPHRHSADEGFHSSSRLVIGCSEPSANIFVIQYLNLEGEVFLELSRR